jgi:amino acid transporter
MPEGSSPSLRRDLGIGASTSYVAGTIIGSGIFISPKAVLQGAGGSVGVALVVWGLCGVLTYMGAMCFSELGNYDMCLSGLGKYDTCLSGLGKYDMCLSGLGKYDTCLSGLGKYDVHFIIRVLLNITCDYQDWII